VAFPAFAQQLYAFPIDATGKAVCANCHLAEAPIRLSGPSAVFASSIFDLLIEIPTLLAAAQVSPAGDLVDLNVGGVVVLPEGFGKSVAADSNIFTPFLDGPCNGWLGRVHISREGPSLGLWTRQPASRGQLGARISIDAVLATNPNVGGVGQSEALLVLQSRERLGYYVQVVAAIAATQLALRGPRMPKVAQTSIFTGENHDPICEIA